MSSLTYLLDYLDRGSFDCIEFGDAAAPGRIAGAVRLRRAATKGTYQASVVGAEGHEAIVSLPLSSRGLAQSLEQFTLPIETQCDFPRFFGLCPTQNGN